MSESSRTYSAKKKIDLLPRTKTLKWPGSHMGEVGTPDLHVTSVGFSFWTEWKEPGERLRSIQDKRLREWEEAGAVTAKITHLDEMIELIIEKTGLFPTVEDARHYIKEMSSASNR